MVPEVSNHKIGGMIMGNIRGLFPKSNPTKIRSMEDIANLKNIHILAFSETHLNSDIYDSEIELNGFISHRGDRLKGLMEAS